MMKERRFLLSLLMAGIVHAAVLLVRVPEARPVVRHMPPAVEVALVPAEAPAPAARASAPSEQPRATAKDTAMPVMPEPVVRQAPKKKEDPPKKREPVPVPEPLALPEPEPSEQAVEEPPEPPLFVPSAEPYDNHSIEYETVFAHVDDSTGEEPAQTASATQPAVTEGSAASPGVSERDYAAGDGVETMPAYSYNPKPKYPRAARQAGMQGVVLLRVEVLFSGKAGKIVVEKSTGSELLDRAAVEAVRRWRFQPAQKRGKPVTAWVQIPVEFSLKN